MGLFLLLGIISQVESTEVSGFDRPMVDVALQSVFDSENVIDVTGLSGQYGSAMSMSGDLATQQGYEFAFWVVNGVVRYDLPLEHEFRITENIEIKAFFSKSDEHVVVFMDANGQQLDVQYIDSTSGVATDVTTNLPDKPGYVVSTTNKWDKPLDAITDDTVLILQYVKDTTATFDLTVNMGTGAGTYDFNEEVTIEPLSPDFFSHWEDESGTVLSYSPSYTFTMLEDTSIIAAMTGTPETPQPLITVSDDLDLRTGYHSHVAQFYLPDGYELIEYGMVGTSAPFDNFTLDFEGADRYQGFKYNGRTNEFLMSFDESLVTNPRAYLVYEYNGVMDVVYSESTVSVVLEKGAEDGIGYAEIRVQDGEGGYIQTFAIHLDGAESPEASTTNGHITSIVKEADLDRFQINIDGVYYDIDEMIPAQWTEGE